MSKLCNGHWTRPKPGPSLDGLTELASNRPPGDVLRLGLCLHHLKIRLQRQYITHQTFQRQFLKGLSESNLAQLMLHSADS